MKIKKYYKDFWKAFTKIKWEYFLNFFAMVVGIFFGFMLANYQNDLSLKTELEAKLEFMKRECDYNMGNGFEVKKNLEDTVSFYKLYPKMSTSSILSVINDPYTNKIINYDLYNLLLGYLQICENINFVIPRYNEHIIANNYQYNDNLSATRKSLVHYLSYFLAQINLIKSELNVHFGIRNQYTEGHKVYKSKIDSLKHLYLNNKIDLYEY